MQNPRKGLTPLKVNVDSKVYKLVPINTLKRNTLNAAIYGDEYLSVNSDYILQLAKSIFDNGLDHPLEVCSDGVTLIGGHHRLEAISGLGFDEVPVIVTNYEPGEFSTPGSRLSMMNMLARNNMQNTYTQWQRYEQAERWCKVYLEENGNGPRKQTYNSQFGSSIGFTWTPLTYARQLRDGYTWKNKNPKGEGKVYEDLSVLITIPPRPDLLDNVKGGNGRKTRSFKNAHDTQFLDQIAKLRRKSNPQRLEHDKLKIDRAVIRAVEEASKWVRSILEYDTEFCGQNVTLGFNQDVNTMSAMLHGGITKLLPAALKHELNIDADAPDGGSHFDVIAKEQPGTEGYEWQLELKCNIGDKENWSSGSDKIGYCLLVRADKSFKNFFVAYVYVPEKYPVMTRYGKNSLQPTTIEMKDCWTGGGAIKTKKLSKGCVATLLNGMAVKVPKPELYDVPADKLREDEWLDYFPIHGRCILGSIEEKWNGVKRTINIGLESVDKRKQNAEKIEIPNTFFV